MFFRLCHSLGLAIAVLLAVAVAPAQAEWRRGESRHFIVYGNVSEGAMRSYVRKVERFDSVLRLSSPQQNGDDAPKLEIFLADGIDDLRAINPSIGSTIGGFYSATNERIFAVVDLKRSEDDQTLFHEYAHHFMLANMPGAYPAWFVEGFAEFFSTADMDSDRVRLGLASEGRLYSLSGPVSGWVPMETVLGSRTRQLRSGQGANYYAQAWALTSYLLSTPERRQQLSRYLAAVMDGQDPIAALDGTIGQTPDELQDDVWRSLARNNFAIVPQTFAPADVQITTMPRGTADLIWLDLRLARPLAEDAKASVLDQARALAARYPDQRLAAIVLAKAAAQADDWSQVETALEPYVVSPTPDPEALWLAARARLERAEAESTTDEEKVSLRAEARSLLTRAVRLAPTDFRLYTALADTRRAAPDYPTDADLEILLAAAAYAPQVTNTRFRAAQALVSQGIYRQAIDLLAPIANNPHGGSGMQPVRDLLAEARAKAGITVATGDIPDDVDDAPPEG